MMKTLVAIALGLTFAGVLAGCRTKPQTTPPAQSGTQTQAQVQQTQTEAQESAAVEGMAAVVTDQSLGGAFAAAAKDGKPIIAIFSAPSWCVWCRKLDKETLTDTKVKEELKKFRVVFVDFDKETALDSQYGISGVPTTILFNSSGKRVHDIIGFRDAGPYLDEIKQAFAG
jgi:thiol:disulfide interchange protein